MGGGSDLRTVEQDTDVKLLIAAGLWTTSIPANLQLPGTVKSCPLPAVGDGR